jgi:hypothetical protein
MFSLDFRSVLPEIQWPLNILSASGKCQLVSSLDWLPNRTSLIHWEVGTSIGSLCVITWVFYNTRVAGTWLNNPQLSTSSWFRMHVNTLSIFLYHTKIICLTLLKDGQLLPKIRRNCQSGLLKPLFAHGVGNCISFRAKGSSTTKTDQCCAKMTQYNLLYAETLYRDE